MSSDLSAFQGLADKGVDCGEYIWVTCGNMAAKLIKHCFICPGIHAQCIEMEDGFVVTPKGFTVMGEKASLKDWKTAIRVNGRPLRRYMEQGYLDFHKHNEICTMRCFPRSAVTSVSPPGGIICKEEIIDPHSPLSMHHCSTSPSDCIIDAGGSRDDVSCTIGDFTPSAPAPKRRRKSNNPSQAINFHEFGANQTSITIISDVNHNDLDNIDQPLSYDQRPNHNNNNLCNIMKNNALTVSKGNQRSKNVVIRYEELAYGIRSDDDEIDDDGDDNESRLLLRDGPESSFSSYPHINNPDECRMFWQCIVEVGLMDDVFQDIHHSVQQFKRKILNNTVSKKDAQHLSIVVNELNLIERLRLKLSVQNNKIQTQGENLDREVEELRKKVAVVEARKQELDDRSRRFSKLLSMSSGGFPKYCSHGDDMASPSHQDSHNDKSPSRGLLNAKLHNNDLESNSEALPRIHDNESVCHLEADEYKTTEDDNNCIDNDEEENGVNDVSNVC